MKQFDVTGMSCAACQARVEKAVSSVEGVTSCTVNLLTGSMGVEGSASPEVIIQAVVKAGYGASLKKAVVSLEDKETLQMKKRLLLSILFLVPLMYFSMGHKMFGFPLPNYIEENCFILGFCQMVLSGFVLFINRKFFLNGFKGLFNRSPNMDSLIALGSGTSFVYSVFVLFTLNNGRGDFYFESAAMILTLITVGKMLEARSKGKTTDALKALMELAPKTAVLLKDGKESTVPVESVVVGDCFVVRPGDSIPVDGVVVEGESAVNEAALTGESVPVEKQVGDNISAATLNTSGFMICMATRVGENTTLSGIIKLVSEAAATKAPIAKIADKVSGIFVPFVIAVSLLTFAAWLAAGSSFGYAIARGVSVLVISCPCALGLATPVAIMVGSGVGARSGILFKTAVSLEQTGKTQIVVLDKTGTITTGVMQVTDVVSSEKEEKDLLVVAFSLEAKSEHPISKAIVEYARKSLENPVENKDFETVSGNGLKAVIDGKKVFGGNFEFISKYASVSEEMRGKAEELASQGKTPVYFAEEEKLLGIIGVSDSIKPDSPEAILRLKKMGIHVVMLTGDNEVTARAIGTQAGVDEVIASVRPDGKEAVVRKLMEKGTVTMVGDGINDAPALTRAHVGMAIGAGTDIAIDAADVVLMKSSLMDVAGAIQISRKTLRNIHENLFWAFFYNVIGIPLACGCYVHAFGWTLNPMFGAAAMGLSSFCVVTNALRLNFIKINNIIEENEEKTDESKSVEDNNMKINVKGMMCSHCEGHVKKALEALDGIECAVPSHEENLVVLTTSKPVDEDAIKAAIIDAGYEYCGILE